MKFVYAIAAVLVLAIASPVHAQQQVGVQMQTPVNPLYFGLRAGAMDADGLADEASNVGVLVGYKLHEDERGAFFGEAEYSRSFADGDTGVGGGEFDVETLGAYGGFRSAGPWFWKAKAGFTWFDIAIDGPTAAAEGDDTGLSFGIGGGARLNDDTGVEVEYTFMDSDLSFLSVGVFTRF